MSYTTQMDAAKKGIFTKQMEDVLKEETHITKDFFNAESITRKDSYSCK